MFSTVVFPESPRSTASHLSHVSGSPPALDTSTLALLDAYFTDKAEQERRFNEIAAEKAAALVAGLALEEHAEEAKPMISVVDFRLAFGEDWQLSQFWYTDRFANTLADHLHALCNPSTKIAFVCCPTAFVAFQHKDRLEGAKLLEWDQRFAVLSPKQFVPYDMEEPDDIPDSIKGTFDIAVVDPPYLNGITNERISKTLRLILKPKGKLLIITSTSVEDILHQIYDTPPLGPLFKTQIVVDHGRLVNDFACWGSWDGAEEFGREP